jgi:hypothetical protein
MWIARSVVDRRVGAAPLAVAGFGGVGIEYVTDQTLNVLIDHFLRAVSEL